MIITELYRIRYLLLIELSLLILFAAADYIPFFIFLGLILLAVILFISFNLPVVAIHVLLFSILADSFVPIKKDSFGPSLSIPEFFLIILLGLIVIKFLFNYEKEFDVPNLILIWIPFLIWGLSIGLLVGVEKLRILTYWKNYSAGFFALCLTYYTIKNKFQLKAIVGSIIIWGVLLSLLEIKVLIELGGFTTGIIGLFLKKNLLTLGWGKSNYLAAFFVVIIPVTIGYLIYSKTKVIKILITGALILMSFALILTLSRGGVLSLFIALIILFSRVLKSRTFIPFLIVLLIIAIVLLSNPLTFVLIDRISSLDATSSYFTRINFYKDVWNAFLNHPLTGVGFGNLSFYSTFILARDASPSAHNIVLGMLGEVGIFGAIFFFSIIAYLLKNLFSGLITEVDKSLKTFRWCFISSLIGALIHSLMEPTLEGLQFSIVFWTLVGIYLRLDMLRTSNS